MVQRLKHPLTHFPRVIAFFGPDGAGKTTQATLLVDFLESEGYRVKKAWVRSTHTVAFLLWMIFYKLNLCEDRSGFLSQMRTGFAVSYLNESDYGAVSPITMSPPVLKGRFSKLVWSLVEILGILPVVVLQVYAPLLTGRIIVAERFLADSVASIAYFLGDVDFDRTWQASLLIKLIPRDTTFIFVDADYDTIKKRRSNVAGPRDYTEFHRRLYFKLASRLHAVRIDMSANSIEKGHDMILKAVLREEIRSVNRSS